MFRFRLDAGSGVPPYLQIVHQVRQALLMGHLAVGDRLPTVKDAVGDLAVNPNTVVKAYRQLEHEGLVSARPGAGTFVVGEVEPVPAAARAKLRRSLAQWLRGAYEAGLDEAMIDAMLADTRQAVRAERAA
ncbi:GntR family transcriptional regulator [Yinghuangia seranimata]|uniref:GntR family transcriptional regulator n=1 Tax=Yinghuangia seranimata TaxID=408067 RepID=UPI00248A92C6|nr:GntR family transcriptional regulator [Yinghuangia seranimata]MDI2130689.1 GntR family transcriptional regulator [Yinghuangia seranimata]